MPTDSEPGGSDVLARVQRELAPDLHVVRLLGRSAVAQVYLAREPALKRLVAVKVLAPALSGDGGALRRFEREAQSAARIAHPNTVTVYRVGRLADGLPYLVMRYVKGRSLEAQLASEGPYRVEEGCSVLLDVTSAVAAGHRRRVVHRDIKPSNVLVEAATGQVFVVDFGLAAILASGEEEPERITTVGHIIGDPQYMSPERLRGEPAGERSDVYNLGLLGYELLAGRGAFDATSNREWTAAHLSEGPIPIRKLRPEIDDELEHLLLRCLAKNPDHRPDAEDFEAALRAFCRTGREATPRSAPVTPPELPRATEPPPAPPDRPKPPVGLAAPHGHTYRLDLLGTIDLAGDDGNRILSIVAQPKRVALLAYLAAGSDEEFRRRDRIVSVFWPDDDEEKGRHALRQALYVLRQSLGSDTIVSRGDDEIGLDREVVWSDVDAFERAIAAGRPDVAMDLYRGPLLPGFYLNDVIEFEHWLDNERNRLERLATEAAWELAAERETSGDLAGAMHWARRAADLAPFDESLLRRLLELHVRAGDRAGALNAFESFGRRLREELEAEPMEQTLELVERIRGG